MKKRSNRAIASIMWLGLMGLCAAVLSLAAVFLYLDPQTPEAESYRHVSLETPLRVFAEDGKLIGEFGERRLIPVDIEEVPQQFIDALLDTEDKRFYEHSGIDFISLANDSVGLIGSLLFDGEVGSGASTITMQLARNISFGLEKRFLRKFKEMLLALKIEQELSKPEILELYINVVPFGKRAYGAQAAAQTYYGKTLDQLNLAQLAMLAGIPQRPSAGNPINGPDWAVRRRNQVLSRMLAQESITQAQHDEARAAPISARVYRRELDVSAPYAAEMVRRQLIYSLTDLYTGGYEVTTTLDSRLQQAAQSALRRGLEDYDQRHGYRGAEATLDIALIDEAGEDEAKLAELAVEQLRQLPPIGGYEPAAVLSVDDELATLVAPDGARLTLDLESVAWARPFQSINSRGPAPAKVSDVLQVGDVVRVAPLAAPPEDVAEDATEEAAADQATEAALLASEDSPAQRWRLVQIPEIQGAIVSLDPQDGSITAIEGGYDFALRQYNHAIQAARQPGSGFKPFVYSAALEHGVTPASVFVDAPLVFNDENLETEYRPTNSNRRYNGDTRLREALYRSINLVSMRVLQKIEAGNVIEHAKRFGFDTRTFPRNTQLAIGGGTMALTPIDMAKAYAVLANGGFLIEPHIIKTVSNLDGETVLKARHPVVCAECIRERERAEAEAFLRQEELAAAQEAGDLELVAELEALMALESSSELTAGIADAATETAGTDNRNEADAIASDVADSPIEEQPLYAARAIDERNAFLMQSMLRDVIQRGTGVKAKILERSDIAGKTGTTNDAADTWFKRLQ